MFIEVHSKGLYLYVTKLSKSFIIESTVSIYRDFTRFFLLFF